MKEAGLDERGNVANMQDSMDLMPVVCSDKECYEDERRMVCISEEVRREQRRGARKRLKRPGGGAEEKEGSL